MISEFVLRYLSSALLAISVTLALTCCSHCPKRTEVDIQGKQENNDTIIVSGAIIDKTIVGLWYQELWRYQYWEVVSNGNTQDLLSWLSNECPINKKYYRIKQRRHLHVQLLSGKRLVKEILVYIDADREDYDDIAKIIEEKIEEYDLKTSEQYWGNEKPEDIIGEFRECFHELE